MKHFQVDLARPDSSLYIKVLREIERKPRVVGVVPKLSLRMQDTGKICPVCMIPDPDDVDNKIAAAVHRFGRAMPDVNSRLDVRVQKRFLLFAKDVIKKLPALPNDELKTLQQWFDSSTYSSARKRQLLRSYVGGHINRTTVDSKSFIKNEGYDKAKPPRGINSPSDFSKVLLGPIIKSIEKHFFAMRWFVKGTNPREWPKKMEALFEDRPVCRSDFTSFEAHHFGPYAELFRIFIMHMIHPLLLGNWFKRVVSRMVVGTNHCSFKNVSVQVRQRLMSGVVWTSLANSLLNWLVMSFIFLSKKHPNEECLSDYYQEFVGLIEGDDGIVLDIGQDESIASALGMILKFERYPSYEFADFCGIICTSQSNEVLPDPMKVLRNFFVLDGKYADAKDRKHETLLRAKAMSFKYLYGNAPIVGSLCDWILDETKPLNVMSVTETERWSPYSSYGYVKEGIKDKVWRKRAQVTCEARQLCSKCFKITPEEQICIENDIKSGSGCVRPVLRHKYRPDLLEYNDIFLSTFKWDRYVTGGHMGCRYLLDFMVKPKKTREDIFFARTSFPKIMDVDAIALAHELGVPIC